MIRKSENISDLLISKTLEEEEEEVKDTPRLPSATAAFYASLVECIVVVADVVTSNSAASHVSNG